MKFYFLTFFMLFFVLIGNSQNDFQEIDDYIRSTKFKTKDFVSFTQKITEKSETELEKVRAIFVWITDNIKYSDKFMNDKATSVRAGSKAELERALKKIKEEDLQRTLQKRKGVCEDYSQLFKEMCSVVGIESEFVVGHARQNKNRIGKLPKGNDHAWNSVKVDGKWYLLDVTWASGYVNNGKFKKEFKEGYFLVEPEHLIKSHFPEEAKFQYLEVPITKKAFSKIPVIQYGYYKFKVQDHIPQQAKVPPFSGDGVFKIQLEKDDLVKGFFLETGSKLKPLVSQKDGDYHIFKINLIKNKNKRITILAESTDGELEELLTYIIK